MGWVLLRRYDAVYVRLSVLADFRQVAGSHHCIVSALSLHLARTLAHARTNGGR